MANKQRPPRATKPSAKTGGQGESVRPSLQYSILCDSVQQLPDGTAVIVRPFDTVNRVGDQPQPATMVILNGWTSGIGVWNEHITITDPNGKRIAEEPEQSFWLQSLWHRHNIQRVLQLVLLEPGQYTVRVFLANQPILEYRFRFVIHPQQGTSGV